MDESWAKALRIVRERLPQGYELSEAQLIALQAAWEQKGYREYAKKGCSIGYMSNVVMEIYALLGKSIGEDVKKNNFREIIEKIILGDIYLEEYSGAPLMGTPPRIDNFLGREKEEDLIKDKFSENKMIVINGNGGVGKTSLASVAFQKISKTRNFQKYIWYSIVRNSLRDNILEINKLLDHKKTLFSLDDFFNYIETRKVFIVIDGIDICLTKDIDETNDFIKKVVNLHHSSLILMTCCNGMQLSRNLERQGYPILNIKLEGLSLEASRKLFQIKGVEDKGVEKIIVSTRGIPSMILDACEKIGLMNGNIDEYIKNKTLFATNSSKERLNRIFEDINSRVKERERYILYSLVKAEKSSLSIDELMNQVDRSKYPVPDILEAIEILDDSSLISINRKENSVEILKHDEVRGYIAQDPLNLFQYG